MREHVLGLALVLAGCASSTVERQRLADGSWHLTCGLPMDECARQADQLCTDQRYRILRGESRHVVRGAGPSQVEYRISDLTFACGGHDDDASPSSGVSTPQAIRAAEPANPVKPVCTPGGTQACVGPGGCSGGQACTTNGSAFGPCDCGSPKSPGTDAG
jgi:hypothetical protein